MLKKTNLYIVLILGLVVPVLLPFFNAGFFPTQDYIYVARVYEMFKALSDGQFPVRWVGDFRYGEPLFNYYAPLAYYVGAAVKLFGFSYLQTVKILFGLGFALSGITMYLLARKFFGNLGGLISAVFYIYAPYHSVDVYVRGALSESWALIFFPLIFLSAYNLSLNPTSKNLIYLGLSLAALFYTHNIMTVLFAPFIIGWFLFLAWEKKSKKVFKFLSLGLLLGVALASSFLLPAFFEKDLVQSNKLITGYFDYRAHFVTISEMYLPSWGYGASLWGPVDDMSFQVGVVHLATLVLALIIAIYFRSKLILLLISGFLLSQFMQHNRSQFVWDLFPLLAFTQFPWRFLGISIFLISFAVGGLGLILKGRWGIISYIFVAIVIFVNINYFKPESFYLDSVDDHYISAKTLSVDDKLPKDYLPIWVRRIKDEKSDLPYAVSGSVKINDFNKNSYFSKFEVQTDEPSEIEVPITYFPGWKVFVNGKSVKIEDPSELGLIKFKVDAGKSQVEMLFANTWIRNLGNLISLTAIIIVIVLLRKKYAN